MVQRTFDEYVPVDEWLRKLVDPATRLGPMKAKS